MTTEMSYDEWQSDEMRAQNPQFDTAPQAKSAEERSKGPGSMESNAKGPHAVVEADTPHWLEGETPQPRQPSTPTDHGMLPA